MSAEVVGFIIATITMIVGINVAWWKAIRDKEAIDHLGKAMLERAGEIKETTASKIAIRRCLCCNADNVKKANYCRRCGFPTARTTNSAGPR